VDPHLQPREKRETVELLTGQLADLKDVIEADADAVLLALAAVTVNDRLDGARCVAAARSVSDCYAGVSLP
jgi:hypothetical protein